MNTNLVNIIKNSLAAAQAALDLIAVQETAALVTAVSAAPASVAPTPTPVLDEVVADAAETPFNALMRELQDPRYTLRSTRELTEKTGVHWIGELLNDNDVEFVVKRRRSDGAELIGLASRN